jgi:alkylhydroperoxidase family enzyme
MVRVCLCVVSAALTVPSRAGVGWCDAEWEHHAPLAVAAGVSEEALQGIKSGTGVALSPKQYAAWAYAVEMTRDVKVKDETFARLREHCEDDREVVEITGTCAGYKLSHPSRTRIALHVHRCGLF